MLERYTLTLNAQQVKEKYSIDPTSRYKPFYNGAPTHLLPVITHLHPDGFSFFYWGLPPEMTNQKPITRKLINAEKDQLTTRISYKNALIQRRCIMPADGFYLWKKVSKKGKVPYRFIFNGEEPFMIAGIWEEFDSAVSSDTHTFMMITTDADESYKSFTDALPAIIQKKNVAEWLDTKTPEERLIQILNEPPKEEIGSYPVSSLINNIQLNNPDLVQHSKPIDQFGNYSLFD
jgi:putative SOS response-associated peptidase YedK